MIGVSDVALDPAREPEARSVGQLDVEDRRDPSAAVPSAASAAAMVCAHSTSRCSFSSRSVERAAERLVVFDEQHARHQSRSRQLEHDGQPAASRRRATNRSAPCIRATSWRHTNRPTPVPLVSPLVRERLAERVERRRPPRRVRRRRRVSRTRARRRRLDVHASPTRRRRARPRSAAGCARRRRSRARRPATCASPVTLHVELRPVLREPRDRGADVDPLAQQPAVRLRDEQRVLELDLEAHGVVQQPVERSARRDVGPVLAQASACSCTLASEVFRSCVNDMKNVSSAWRRPMLAPNRQHDRDAAGDEQRDERARPPTRTCAAARW